MGTSSKSIITLQLKLSPIKSLENYLVCFFIKQLKVMTMRNTVPEFQSNQHDDYRKRYQAEMQRKFVDLQFKRSELEEQLKRVNDVLFSLGREMEAYFAYDQFYN